MILVSHLTGETNQNPMLLGHQNTTLTLSEKQMLTQHSHSKSLSGVSVIMFCWINGVRVPADRVGLVYVCHTQQGVVCLSDGGFWPGSVSGPSETHFIPKMRTLSVKQRGVFLSSPSSARTLLSYWCWCDSMSLLSCRHGSLFILHVQLKTTQGLSQSAVD